MTEFEQLKNRGHVVLITSPFFGHIFPLLDFGKRLSMYHNVTYVVSASKLDTLKQRGFLDENDNNKLVLPYSKIDFIGLFDHNDDDYELSSSNEKYSLSDIIDRMREPLSQLLFPESIRSSSTSLLTTQSIDRPIDLIISDMFVHMPIRNAYERNILAHVFVPCSFGAVPVIINCSMGEVQSGLSREFASTILETFSLAKGFICNSIDELDERTVDDLRQRSLSCSNLPVRFVAPLISIKFDDKQNTDTITHVKQWLDAQWVLANKSPSVIYIAFGTIASLTPEQLVQIADALMPYPTIWSLKTTLHKHLPSSFIDNQKHLLLNWAPQRFILSHPAIRLFLSHGGWNSLLECMLAGKPVLVWPFFADQIINGSRIEKEFGIGKCIQNTDYSHHQQDISSNEITRHFEQMFERETEYIQKAQQIQKMFTNAKENDSRLCFEQINKIIDDQVFTRIEKHNKL